MSALEISGYDADRVDGWFGGSPPRVYPKDGKIWSCINPFAQRLSTNGRAFLGYLMGDVFAIETSGMYQCDIQLLMLNGNRIWVSQEWTWSLNRR